MSALHVLSAEKASLSSYRMTAERVRKALLEGHALGYTSGDLASLSALLADEAGPGPFALRTDYYHQREIRMAAALQTLPQVESEALGRHRADARAWIARAATAVQNARTMGADPDQVDEWQAIIDKLGHAVDSAERPLEAVATAHEATQLVSTAAAAVSLATSEQAERASAADALLAKSGGDLRQVRAAGERSLRQGRDDATVAAMLGLKATASTATDLEHARSSLSLTDPYRVANAAIRLDTYARQIHEELLSSMPSRTITISLAAQELWAYQGGRVVRNTLVTTGRATLPTDVGAMHVLAKNSPWTMHSPWPTSSPFWYPDTQIEEAIWFTVSGEALHDSPWEPNSAYGPGGQLTPSASHGCVHVPLSAERFLYDWAPVGTPVLVYPGDGSPVADQLRQVTVDANGVPLDGVRGS